MRLLNQFTRSLWSVIILAGTLGLVGYLAFIGWQHFGPQKPEVNAARRELAELVLPVIAEDLALYRTNAATVVLTHLSGDTSDLITDRLRALLSGSGSLFLVAPPLEEKVRRILNLQVTSPSSLEAALASARGSGADAVIFGRVHRFAGTAKGGRLTLEISIADLRSGEVLLHRTYDREWDPLPFEPLALQAPEGRSNLVSRLLGWALVVLLLPVFSIGFIRSTVRRGSNRANATALILYTLVAAILAWLVVGATLASVWSAIWLAGLTALAFAYHVWIMTVAVRIEDK
jgi:hypothetical protein